MKKILNLMLIVVMVLSMFAGMTVTASAATGTGPSIKIDSYSAKNGKINVDMDQNTSFDVYYTITNPTDADATYDVWWRIATESNKVDVAGTLHQKGKADVIVRAHDTYSDKVTVTIPAGTDISDAKQLRLHLRNSGSGKGSADISYSVVYTTNVFVCGHYVTLHNNGGLYNGSATDPVFFVDAERHYGSLAWPKPDGSQYSRPGYTMLGYDKNSNAADPQYTIDGLKQVEWKTSDQITEWYAIWKPNDYKVTFHSNNGNPETVDQSFVYGQAQSLKQNTFTKEETLANGDKVTYKFMGWAETAGGNVVHADGATVDNLTTTQDGNVDLYAVWTPIPVSVPAQGATYFVEHYVEESDGSYTLKETEVLSEKIGTTVNADSDKYINDTHHVNDTISTLNGAVSFDLNAADPMTTLLTLKVYYDLNEYTVTFRSNNGKNETAVQNFVYTEEEALNANAFVHPGYTFRGWATSADGNVAYSDKELVSNLTKAHKGNIDLYAVWTPNPVYVEGTIYYVEYYVEEPDGSYTQIEKKVMYGDFGTTVKADSNKYLDAEYHVNAEASTLEGKISVLGPTLTLKVYYDLNETATETADQARIDALADFQLVARSKRTNAPSGKDSVRIIWYDKYGADLDAFGFDGFEIYRSEERYKGYGVKPFFVSKTGVYYNTKISKGDKYYYKVRGYIIVDGEKHYTDWSLKAWRTVK